MSKKTYISNFKYSDTRQALIAAEITVDQAIRRHDTFVDLDHLGIEASPDGLMRHRSLKSLHARYNRLRVIPPLIGELTNIKELDVSRNFLSVLPVEIFGLIDPQRFIATHDKLTGIPNATGRMQDLKLLDLQKNQLDNLPREPSNLTVILSAARKNRSNGIFLRNNPLRSPIALYVKSRQPFATDNIIKFLRNLPKSGLIETGAANDTATLELLANARQGIAGAPLVVEGERLAIGPTGKDPDSIAAVEPISVQMQGEVQRKVEVFLPYAMRLDNQLGWKGIAAACELFLLHLEKSPEHIAMRIAEVWSLAVELGSFLEFDQKLQSAPQDSTTSLDEDVRRNLGDLVRTAAPWARRFPTGRHLDGESGAFFARRDLLAPASEVFDRAEKYDLISTADKELLTAMIEAAMRGEVQGSKSAAWSTNSARNLVMAVVGVSGTFYLESISSYHSGISIIAKKSGDVVVSIEQQAIKLLKYFPADIKIATETLVGRLQFGDAPGHDIPRGPQVDDRIALTS